MTWWRSTGSAQRMAWIVGALLISGVVAIICASFPSSTWDFRNNLWGPAHLLLTGRSPYRIDQLFDGSNSVWMPTTIGAFLPLGLLTLSQASLLWGFVTLASLLLCLVAAAQMERPYPVWLAAALIAGFLFPPTVTHFQWGQFSWFAALLALVTARLLERKASLGLVALTMVAGAAKPQLYILAGVGVLAWLWHAWGWRAVARLAAWGVAWVVIFAAPLFLLFPGWIDGLLWAFGRNPTWLHPSSFVMLRLWFGTPGLFLWAALMLAALAVTVWLWRRFSPFTAMIWTLALTPLTTPYMWSYDFVLLLPAMIYTLFRVRHLLSRILWIVGYAAIWGAFAQLRLASSNSDHIFWWVPAACLALVGICWAVDGVVGRSAATPPLKP